MKQIIIILILLCSIFLIGCEGRRDDNRYIIGLKLGDTLDVSISNLAIKESNDNYTKYTYREYDIFRTPIRDYYFTVNKRNVILSIYSIRKEQ